MSLSLSTIPLRSSSLSRTISLSPSLVRLYSPKKKDDSTPAPPPSTAHIPTTGSARTGGGVFSQKQAAQEDQWAYSHDKELFERLAKKLKAKVEYHPESPVVAKGDAEAGIGVAGGPGEKAKEQGTSPILGGQASVATGSFGRKQAAQEDQYIYEHDKELLSKINKKA
ncbi:hypothetical protein HDU93_005473 [Gonapodya sp. JEL0774]|nr:hypothetical protein HDU93_005473 [Gonapodya sp. JEL0774]